MPVILGPNTKRSKSRSVRHIRHIEEQIQDCIIVGIPEVPSHRISIASDIAQSVEPGSKAVDARATTVDLPVSKDDSQQWLSRVLMRDVTSCEQVDAISLPTTSSQPRLTSADATSKAESCICTEVPSEPAGPQCSPSSDTLAIRSSQDAAMALVSPPCFSLWTCSA
jgi:hypothetical protein